MVGVGRACVGLWVRTPFEVPESTRILRTGTMLSDPVRIPEARAPVASLQLNGGPRLENQEIARVLWETADLMEIAGEDSFRIRSYRNGATAVEGYPERIADILRDPEPQCHRDSRNRQGAGARSGGDRGARLLRAARPAAAEVPSHGPRVPQDSGARSQEHRAHLRALPHQHHRRAGAPLPGAEAARAAAHGRQAGREGAALHRAIPPAQRPLPAELCGSRGGGIDRGAGAGSGRRSRHARRQPAARARNGGRSRPAGHRPRRPRRARALCDLPARGRGAGPRREQGQRQSGPRRLAGGCARAGAREFRRRAAILHRQQGPQRGHPHARREDGAEAQRVRPVPRGGRYPGGGRDRSRRLRGARPALDSARAARKLRRNRSRRRGPPAGAGGTAAHPRRPPHAHHRNRRPRHARRDGRSRPRPRLRVHRHHRPLEGARHGQRAG